MSNRYVEEEARLCEAAFKKLKPKNKKRAAKQERKKQRRSTQPHPPANITYQEYIKSHWWAALRKRIFKKRGRKCEVCGATKRLQLHHLTYERMGRERESDLKILCRHCHELTHELHPDVELTDELSQKFRAIIG